MGRNSDDRSGDRILEVDLSVPLQLQQYPSADLRRQVRGPVDLDVPVRTHVALDRPDGALRAGDGLTLGRVTHQNPPPLPDATTDGVIGDASALGITKVLRFRNAAITEFVVPRSMPTALEISQLQSMTIKPSPARRDPVRRRVPSDRLFTLGTYSTRSNDAGGMTEPK